MSNACGGCNRPYPTPIFVFVKMLAEGSQTFLAIANDGSLWRYDPALVKKEWVFIIQPAFNK